MAIQVYCSRCRSSYKLGTTECPKCGPFGKKRTYRVHISGRDKPFTKYYHSLTLAREAEAAIKADILRGNLDINQKAKPIPTLGEVWGKYLPWAMGEKKTWITDKFNYEKHLEPRFGKKRLDTISPFDVDKLKIEMKKGLNKNGKPYTEATIKHQLVLLKRLYRMAIDWRMYSGEIPVKREHIPKLDNQVTEYFREDELTRLHQTLDSWPCRDSAAFVKFALYTGFRRGEIFKLTWDDIDFERSMVTLRQPKGGKTETIKVSNEALDVLREIEATSPYVFPGKAGGQRTDFKGPWKRIRKAAGLPDNFRFHGLRHNFASYMVGEFGLEVVGSC